MDLTRELANESFSDYSSMITGSNRLSNSSLSASSHTTHSSSNNHSHLKTPHINSYSNHSNGTNGSGHCAVCNKKIRKKKTIRQNAVEIADPFDSKMPGSQITLTPELPLMPPVIVGFSRQQSSTCSSGSGRKLVCKHCTQTQRRSKLHRPLSNGGGPDFPSTASAAAATSSTTPTSSTLKREPSIIAMIRTTFTKLFDMKSSKSPSSGGTGKQRGDGGRHLSGRSNGTVSPPLSSHRLSSSSGGFGGGTSSVSQMSSAGGGCGLSGAESSCGGGQHSQLSSSSANEAGPGSNCGSCSSSSLNTLSASTANTRHHYNHSHHHRRRRSITVPARPDLDFDRLNRRNPRFQQPLSTVGTQSHACLQPTQSCPSKSKSLCSQFSRTNRGLLRSSWPPLGYMSCLNDRDNLMESNEEELYLDRLERLSQNRYEFNIPFEDIRLGEMIKSGPRKKIYKGHWHGDVTVFMFENLSQEDRSRFWEKVSSLTLIRHENIILFMGASIEPPHFLMVTSSCHGPSLYEKIHMSREKMRQSQKVALLRQISQAVGYLHGAKSQPVVVRRLNSRNIYLEPKVMLSLLDYSHLEQDDIEILDQLSIPVHLVWYAAPEILMASSQSDSEADLCDWKFPLTVPRDLMVQATDVFSFGTLIYEIHAGRYPYSKKEAREFVNDARKGVRPDVKDLRASDTIKHLLIECWSQDPLSRPEFGDISRELMKRDATRKRHSSSVPGNLNRDNSLTGGNL